MKKENIEDKAKSISSPVRFIEQFRKAYNKLSRESQQNITYLIQQEDEYSADDILSEAANTRDKKILEETVEEARKYA